MQNFKVLHNAPNKIPKLLDDYSKIPFEAKYIKQVMEKE